MSKTRKQAAGKAPSPPRGKEIRINIRIYWPETMQRFDRAVSANRRSLAWVLIAIIILVAMLLVSGQGYLLGVLLRFWPILP